MGTAAQIDREGSARQIPMSLPLSKNYPPMDALPAPSLPEGSNWHYEPKWDGFRCLAFRDGADVVLGSRNELPLTRYFPELAASLAALKVNQFVLDGEIVIPVDGHLSFDALLMRIHPAASRVLKLSQESPSVFILFDLLVDERGKSFAALPLRERRAKLEVFAARYFRSASDLRLSPATPDIDLARKWFRMGVGLDGIVAKRDDLPYQSGERTGMQKIKTQRTADCVVGGFRYLDKKREVGSLLLGLYNQEGTLDHVGFSSSISNQERPALTKKLLNLRASPEKLPEAKAVGAQSIPWSGNRSTTNLSPKCSSITSPAAASATAPSSFVGGRKKLRATAP